MSRPSWCEVSAPVEDWRSSLLWVWVASDIVVAGGGGRKEWNEMMRGRKVNRIGGGAGRYIYSWADWADWEVNGDALEVNGRCAVGCLVGCLRNCQ
jgi:hypothetical protein